MNFLPSPVQAITNKFITGSAYDYNNPIGTVGNIIRTVISLFMTVAVIYFLIYFLLAGINFITSEGEKTTLETAKKQATYAVIGLSVVFLTYVALKLLGIVFGIDELGKFNITIPTI